MTRRVVRTQTFLQQDGDRCTDRELSATGWKPLYGQRPFCNRIETIVRTENFLQQDGNRCMDRDLSATGWRQLYGQRPFCDRMETVVRTETFLQQDGDPTPYTDFPAIYQATRFHKPKERYPKLKWDKTPTRRTITLKNFKRFYLFTCTLLNMFRALFYPSSGAFPSLHTQPLFTVWCPVRCCFQLLLILRIHGTTNLKYPKLSSYNFVAFRHCSCKHYANPNSSDNISGYSRRLWSSDVKAV
jgi:hypothetical protein